MTLAGVQLSRLSVNGNQQLKKKKMGFGAKVKFHHSPVMYKHTSSRDYSRSVVGKTGL